jgi:hypothetical protein
VRMLKLKCSIPISEVLNPIIEKISNDITSEILKREPKCETLTFSCQTNETPPIGTGILTYVYAGITGSNELPPNQCTAVTTVPATSQSMSLAGVKVGQVVSPSSQPMPTTAYPYRESQLPSPRQSPPLSSLSPNQTVGEKSPNSCSPISLSSCTPAAQSSSSSSSTIPPNIQTTATDGSSSVKPAEPFPTYSYDWPTLAPPIDGFSALVIRSGAIYRIKDLSAVGLPMSKCTVCRHGVCFGVMRKTVRQPGQSCRGTCYHKPEITGKMLIRLIYGELQVCKSCRRIFYSRGRYPVCSRACTNLSARCHRCNKEYEYDHWEGTPEKFVLSRDPTKYVECSSFTDAQAHVISVQFCYDCDKYIARHELYLCKRCKHAFACCGHMYCDKCEFPELYSPEFQKQQYEKVWPALTPPPLTHTDDDATLIASRPQTKKN